MAGSLTVGLAAHVDAGKTTLSEAMLFLSGAVRRQGRVDHGDAFLDTEQMEKERGITIFSKEAWLTWNKTDLTLVDTPVHTDFAGETERAVSVMDAAVLVISATEGIQSHTRTLWKLLESGGVPVILFVNKMDRYTGDRKELTAALGELSDRIVDFTGDPSEAVALCDETCWTCTCGKEACRSTGSAGWYRTVSCSPVSSARHCGMKGWSPLWIFWQAWRKGKHIRRSSVLGCTRWRGIPREIG